MKRQAIGVHPFFFVNESRSTIDFGEGYDPVPSGGAFISTGMELRDYYAAHAPVTFEQVLLIYGDADADMTCDTVRAVVFSIWAMVRYEYADAMLRSRIE